MSHGAYVGAYILAVYVLPAAVVVGVAFAFVKPKARAIIASAIAALFWCYSLWVGASMLLYPAPLMTGLLGVAVLIALAIISSLIARRTYVRAFSKVS